MALLPISGFSNVNIYYTPIDTSRRADLEYFFAVTFLSRDIEPQSFDFLPHYGHYS